MTAGRLRTATLSPHTPFRDPAPHPRGTPGSGGNSWSGRPLHSDSWLYVCVRGACAARLRGVCDWNENDFCSFAQGLGDPLRLCVPKRCSLLVPLTISCLSVRGGAAAVAVGAWRSSEEFPSRVTSSVSAGNAAARCASHPPAPTSSHQFFTSWEVLTGEGIVIITCMFIKVLRSG